MKKLILMFLLIVSGSAALYGSAANGTSGYSNGFRHYGKESLDYVSGNGVVILNGTEAKKIVQVNGTLTAKDATLGNLQVNGRADLVHCTIENKTEVNGLLVAASTRFKQEVSVASETIIFDKCTLGSLTVRENKGETGKQTVELRNGTKITGPVYFESGKGEIKISGNSEVSEKLVTGAQITR